jgi:protein-disulfide isomerase
MVIVLLYPRNQLTEDVMSKREQQKKVKEQKQQAAQQREHTKKLMGKFALFVVAPVFLLIVIYTLYSQGPTYSPIEIADNDHVRGTTATPVSIVVYADFQCPACAKETQTMARVWPRVRDKAHLIFRHFPITTTHPHSWTASLYAEAAGHQGRFWEMHDYLFANQAVWSGIGDPELEFESYAQDLNLDMNKLRSDMETDEVVQKIRNDQRGGNSSGVRSTPTIFINGTMVARPTASRIIELVESAFAESEAAG